MIKVNIKWKKEVKNDVDINTEDRLDALELKVEELFKVPRERQKLVVKGQYLKHGKPLSSYSEIKAGATINLIGSHETGIKIPLKPWSYLWIGIRLVYSIYCTKNMLQADQWWQSSEIAYSMVYGTLPIHSEDNSDTLRVN